MKFSNKGKLMNRCVVLLNFVGFQPYLSNDVASICLEPKRIHPNTAGERGSLRDELKLFIAPSLASLMKSQRSSEKATL
jgi:hypothetical protein